MRKSLTGILLPCLLVLHPLVVFAHGTDAAAVRSVAVQQADAWNKHDAVAYSALFTPDCDVVTVPGWWWKSRAEMQRKLAHMFTSAFRDSVLTFTDVQVKFLKPDIAVAHAMWKMTGAHMLPGQPVPDKGIQTLVMTKHDGKWLIAEFQNTVSTPEPSLPAAMPSADGPAAKH